MLIANPIYDEVFKYLIADIDIARGILSTIMDEDIVQLDIKPREYVHRSETGFMVYHLDFIAKIRIKTGGYKNVLIERLSHNCFVIQIPALQLQMRNRLEYVLSVFRQENFIDNSHRLKAYNYDTDDQLMRTILKQLGKAAADSNMLRVMELEEMAEREYENAFGNLGRRILETEASLDRTEGTAF